MESTGLLLVGAVLFVNGMVLLGHAEPRNAAIINIFVGLLQRVIPLHLLVTAEGSDDLLKATPLFLCGLTYLWSGITNLTGTEDTALGWYCMWVAGMTLVFSAIEFFHFEDHKQAIIWLNWGVLWALFWRVSIRPRGDHERVAGIAAIVMSGWTCTLPAILTLVGWWKDVPVWPIMIATIMGGMVIWWLSKETPHAPTDPMPATRTFALGTPPRAAVVDQRRGTGSRRHLHLQQSLSTVNEDYRQANP